MTARAARAGAGARAAALRARAERLLERDGYPEAGRTLAGILSRRTLTWVTVPKRPRRRDLARWERAIALADAADLAAPALESRLLRAAARYFKGDLAGCEAELSGALGERPREPRVLAWWAHARLVRGDLDEAVQAAGRVLADGASGWALCLRAEALLKQGRREEARADLERALRLDADRPWAYALLSEVHRELKRFDDALEVLDRLVKRDPEPWSYVLRARTRFNFRDQKAGLADLERALRLDPRFVEGYAFRAEALRRLGRTQEALRDFNRALRGPLEGKSRIRSWRAGALLAAGRPQRALADLTAEIESAPKEGDISWALCHRAHAYLALGRFEEAVADMNRAVSISPKNGWIFGSPGRPGGTLERCDEVVAALSRAVASKPRWPWGWAWRGETLVRAGRHAQALPDLDRAVALAPRQSWFYAWRAQARRGVGDSAGAQADLDSCLQLDADYPPALGFRARWAMEAARWVDAQRDLRRLLELDKTAAWGHAWLGECLLRLGRLEEAASQLLSAVNLDGSYGDAWAWLAEARRRGGRPREALEYARRAQACAGDRWLADLAACLAAGACGDAERLAAGLRRAAAQQPERFRREAAALDLIRARPS